MATFQRARSEEQREERRRAILEGAAAMLAEMPVTALTLNELSRRVGLAKSNVLRYFESREAVLLELLTRAGDDFLRETGAALATRVDADAPLPDRAATVAEVVADTMAAHPMLCELLSTQATVLEHNVSTETVTRYKHRGYATVAGLVAVLRETLPELDDTGAQEAARTVILLTGTVWSHAHPPAAVREAYAADPALVFLPDGFAGSLRRATEVTLVGLAALADQRST